MAARLKFAATIPEKILPIISGMTNAVPTRLANPAPTIGLSEKNCTYSGVNPFVGYWKAGLKIRLVQNCDT